jgi:Tol biopolymer transport system component
MSLHHSLNKIPMTVCALFLLTAIGSPSQAQVLRQLTDIKPDGFYGHSTDDNGTQVVAVSKSDPLVTNPEHASQIFKWQLPSGPHTQVTNFTEGVNGGISISDDGQRITFDSSGNPLGQNYDGSIELFLINSDGTDLVQLTNHSSLNAGDIYSPQIAGNGHRVLFLGTIDPHGANPNHHEQLFLIDTSTHVITQLTVASDSDFETISISDDGERIVFATSGDITGDNADGTIEVFKIEANGQNLTQITSSTTNDSRFPMISGDGMSIVYEFVNQDFDSQVYINTWAGTAPLALAEGNKPSITDNGLWIYFWAVDASPARQIYKVPGTGGTPTQLTNTSRPIINHNPVIAGSNGRILFVSAYGEHPGGSNPDGSPELMVMDVDGTNIQQLTNDKGSEWIRELDITLDATRIVFNWYHSSSGGTYRLNDLYRVQADGSDLTQLTTDAGSYQPTITADGETIVFMSDDDLIGEETCSPVPDVFSVQADGTGLTQLTLPDNCNMSGHPEVAANGSKVVFQSLGSFGELNPEGDAELFTVPPGGGTVSQVTDDDNDYHKNPTISVDGEWAAWHSASIFGGANPNGIYQAFRGRTDGTFVQILTNDPDYGAILPDISGDGMRVVYASAADPLGTNPDHNYEIYFYDATTEITQQLTDTIEGSSQTSKISNTGEIVYFHSTSPFFGPEPGNFFRIKLTTGVIERAGGPSSVSASSWWDYNPNFSIDADGSQVAFVTTTNLSGGNADRSTEAWLADFEMLTTTRPSPEAPTVLEWDPDPHAVRYDIIRGDIDNLQPGASNAVDLGTVVCLENDSIDTNTIGFEDSAQPTQGQAFFFLYRGTQGILDGPGSYGQGTCSVERVASGGDCQP